MNLLNARSAFTILALTFAATGCSDDDDNNTTPDAPAGPGATTFSLSTSGSLGAHLLDKDGKTLYFFANDTPGTATTAAVSACKDACLTTWPIVDAQSPTVGTGLTATDFGRFDRGGGVFQATWRGRPLYHYTTEAAGATGGEGLMGRWFVARAYNVFFAANATITPLGAAGPEAANTPYLTAGNGRTLYVFKNDIKGNPPTSKCTTEQCIADWPIWEKAAAVTTVVVPSTLDAADFTQFENPSAAGKQQFVFKEYPTYFFATDTNAGQVAGAARSNWYTVSGSFNGTIP